MLLKRNLLETVTLISCSGTLLCILLNYVTDISPLIGVWFHLYTLVLFIVSLTFSFKLIQWLLHLNKPLKYDIDDLIKKYPYLEIVSGVLPKPPKKVKRECKEYDTNELSVISTVLERKLVSSWYTHYVSQEIGFPFACKQMLDQMIGKTFQICNKIETKDVYVDVCSVLITHLKEYKKATKRHEKSPETAIESLYKKSHSIYNMGQKFHSADHCTNLLRVILKELVPWELWDTPHSELLVRILSKKLDNFIENTLADPIWLNDKLLTLLNHKKRPPKKVAEFNELQDRIVLQDKLFQDAIDKVIPDSINNVEMVKEEIYPKLETNTIESALSSLVAKTTAPILQRALDEFDAPSMKEMEPEMEEVLTGTEPVEIQGSPILRQRRGRQGRNEVKIYDRIIEGSVKTWETDTDLQCISLGQDLLASLNGEITLSRLWGQDPQDCDGKDSALWFGEGDDDAETEVESTAPSKEPSPVKKEYSPKPTEVLLKDLQTTVHQAKTKIGDLQVPHNVIDVRNNDEAAGMMEGLLDFGISNLKKGLRFTGLSDDSQDKSPSHRERERPAEKSPPLDSKHAPAPAPATERANPPPAHPPPPPATLLKPLEPRDSGITTLLQKEDNGGPMIPPLVKQQRVSSQDSVQASTPRPILRGEVPPPLGALADSPEPEYEEAADLSSSIAKLRSLLQQRAQHSQGAGAGGGAWEEGGGAWWEEGGAEETRGRTHHLPSSRPVDTATLADEYDMHAERNASLGPATNNMQRLDKLFHRTVTGVFNSLKTAVGAEGEAGAEPGGAPFQLQDWTYVCTSIELSVGGAVARLVGSRRAYSHVDAALDSLDQIPPPAHEPAAVVPDDFEEWCAAAGAGWAAGAGAAAAAGLGASHVAHRIATLLLADLAESFIDVYLDEVSAWLRQQIFSTFAAMADTDLQEPEREKAPLREFNLEETCEAIIEKVPAVQVFGADTAQECVRLAVSSLSHRDINKDVLLRAADLLALHFKRAAAFRNPSFDAN